MRKWQGVLAACAVALMTGMAAVNCYNPNITSGGFACATKGKECPDGFSCQAGLCVKGGAVGAGGAAAGGRSGTGGVGGGGGAAVPVRPLGATCLITRQGAADQSDDCEAGLTCMDDALPSGAHCYKICQGDADCPDSACTRTAPHPAGLRQVCEVPFVTCNPQDTANNGCGPDKNCILISAMASSTGAERTTCEFNFASQYPGQACTNSRECIGGVVCQMTGAGAGYCRRVCDPGAAVTGCGAVTCRPMPPSRWGYCFN